MLASVTAAVEIRAGQERWKGEQVRFWGQKRRQSLSDSYRHQGHDDCKCDKNSQCHKNILYGD